ncbi:nucleotidyltransferase family protein [Microbacterium sp. BH-3-3-3]|uniref:nucleotidyltransferase family protein n=1 Tax=Microbacterium sp. BH-3-3-3 TaxID=1906742 RepID=UPI000892A2C2|nr:nucleotidyltransferase family protein [Microbacterium sp. BH-3-3-3]AOX45504.1 hypothetical protein BJP65_06510 [Microbacterium sp. BH-3-3-3]
MTRRGENVPAVSRRLKRPTKLPEVALPSPVAVELLTAAINDFARLHGVRVLTIKGRALTEQGLRAVRDSSDVDVLVDPADFSRLWNILRANGWSDRDKAVLVDLPPAGSVLAPHARTLEHAQWPCHLDLHRYYPGLVKPVQEVFDALWEARGSVRIAHAECVVPSPSDHWLIAAVHAARSHDDAQAMDLEDRARARLDGDLRDVISRARVLGAAGPLAGTLQRVTGQTIPIPADEQRLTDLWSRRLGSDQTLPEAVVEQFADAGWTARLQLAARKVVPSARFAQAFFGVKNDPLSLAAFYIRRAVTAPLKLARIVSSTRKRR